MNDLLSTIQSRKAVSEWKEHNAVGLPDVELWPPPDRLFSDYEREKQTFGVVKVMACSGLLQTFNTQAVSRR